MRSIASVEEKSGEHDPREGGKYSEYETSLKNKQKRKIQLILVIDNLYLITFLQCTIERVFSTSISKNVLSVHGLQSLGIE